jgi:secreted Zn-dependent insulinase-like peptidase
MFVEFFSMGEDTFTVKSQYDNRDNQVINLKNGLQTLLVHYPNIATKGGHQKEEGQKQK